MDAIGSWIVCRLCRRYSITIGKLDVGYGPQILREDSFEVQKEEGRSFTQNVRFSARCNAEARLKRGGDNEAGSVGGELVQCLPGEEDWKKYNQ